MLAHVRSRRDLLSLSELWLLVKLTLAMVLRHPRIRLLVTVPDLNLVGLVLQSISLLPFFHFQWPHLKRLLRVLRRLAEKELTLAAILLAPIGVMLLCLAHWQVAEVDAVAGVENLLLQLAQLHGWVRLVLWHDVRLVLVGDVGAVRALMDEGVRTLRVQVVAVEGERRLDEEVAEILWVRETDALHLLQVLEVTLDVGLVAGALLGGWVVWSGVAAILGGWLSAAVWPRQSL